MNEKTKKKLRDFDMQLFGFTEDIETSLGNIELPISQNMPENSLRRSSANEECAISSTVRPNDEPSP
tara:strand:- start:1087 stop:1287 length:201 start_codon:yes stop_codon:yes gene_type:complete